MKSSDGPIAETYIDLQGLPALEKASKSYATDKCSTWGLVKLLLQTTEIAIQNINNLLGRTISDLNKNNLSKAAAKLSWIKDINGLLIKLSNLNNLVCNEIVTGASPSFVSESQAKVDALYKELDLSIESYVNRKSIQLSKVLETKTLSDPLYKFLHDYRVIAHELTIWNKNMQNYVLPDDTNYSDFIGLPEITYAVNNPHLKGDTFFMQFRCLHQVPELITVEVNDRLEYATVAIRNGENEKAQGYTRVANELFAITLDAFKPLIDDLSHNDYHRFREHLGLTSGSHSANLHFHLFRDLYQAVTTEFVSMYFTEKDTYIATLAKDPSLKEIETQLLTLRNAISQWRDLHLHLPRIDLGENNTRSLIGSKEAVDTARAMQASAQARDPLNKIASLYFSSSFNEKSTVSDYIRSENSFDTKLGIELGKITQARFKKVQEREGVFANPIPFTPPPKRTA